MNLDRSWFHGTLTSNITDFWPLSHFGDKDTAKMVCANKRFADHEEGTATILEVKINITPEEILPFVDVGSPNAKWIATSIINRREEYKIPMDVVEDVKCTRDALVELKKLGMDSKDHERRELSKTLMRHGYKAISYDNEVESEHGHLSLCVLDPSIITIINTSELSEEEAASLWQKSQRRV
jgi:hypothetical protein